MKNKNKYGQYFTIDTIADFMVSLISHNKNSNILEPACGDGVFLNYLIKHGFNHLYAYEIDKGLGKEYNFIQYKSFISVPTSEVYDVIIGNPPYIRWKNLESELKTELEQNVLWNKYFNRLCDYSFIFILKSIEHLKENGELIFICSEYWMNNTYAVSLRNYMCEHGYFEEIYHFKETPLFKHVIGSFVVFKFIKSQKKNGTIKLYKYKNKGIPTINELLDRSCFDILYIPQFQKDTRWILATKEEQENIKLFENACIKENNTTINKIGDYCDIGNGMISGLDSAFQISNTNDLNKDEQKFVIDVLKAKDLQQYKNISKTNYIFIQENISIEDFELKYPNLAKHFKPYINKLENRYSYNRYIPYWEFVFPRNQKMLERNVSRIFIPCKERITNKKHFRFCYAPPGYYSTQDVTAIFKKNNCNESIEYILAYLNNSRVFDWLLYNGIVKGDIVEFSEKPISSIPYRTINWNNENEVSLHNKITDKVRAYLSDNNVLHIDNINSLFDILFNKNN